MLIPYSRMQTSSDRRRHTLPVYGCLETSDLETSDLETSDLGSEVSRSEVSRHPPFTAPEIEPGTHCWEADMATNHLPVHPQIQPLGTYLYLADRKV